MRELVRFVFHPLRTISYAVSRFVYPLVLRADPAVTTHVAVHIRGFPLIEIASGGRLILGAGVKLNSRNEGYHVNMHSPVKLVVGSPGAIIEIGSGTRIHGTCVHAMEGITIGSGCLIAANTQIIDNCGHTVSFEDVSRRTFSTDRSRAVTIGNNVWIGANCFVLPGADIGNGSVIAAGSVVSGTIPERVLAAGYPAVVVRRA